MSISLCVSVTTFRYLLQVGSTIFSITPCAPSGHFKGICSSQVGRWPNKSGTDPLH